MYRKIVGSLIYLTLMRPDISNVVGVLSKFVQNPRKPHLDAVRRVLRYVKGNPSYGVLFERESKIELTGYYDADYARDLDTRHSTSGYMFMISNGAVSWCSRRQPTVSLSTPEAEYRATVLAAQECTWLVRLLKELNQEIENKFVMRGDNISSICLAENPTFHARSKRIEVHYHYIRERVLNREVDIKYINTEEQLDDMLTKRLLRKKMTKFYEGFGMASASVEREY
ncbi:secreted RxLR effector protein 161-like [Helianthus annuus]|uniref:secreted RxLR effector protein 161-like n=1 Tax=Helianthus annuus TaxID=4232 RepID=UPI00165315F3|nr:secreted RxLR effector protein 161-like [Helianthus annuus]